MRNSRRSVRARFLAILTAIGVGLAGAVVPVTAAHAAAWVRGVAVDSYTELPISGATLSVRVVGTGAVIDSGVSDADGEVDFLEVPNGSYYITATKFGYAPSQTSVFQVTTTAFQERPVEMTPTTGVIQGTLIGDELGGVPIEGHSVVISPVGCSACATLLVTDANGFFSVSSLAPGDYVVRFVNFESEYGEVWWQDGIVRDDADAITITPTTVFDASLVIASDAATISGSVTLDDGGAAVPGAEVSIYRVGEVGTPFHTTFVDGSGDWQISGLAPGQYQIQVNPNSVSPEFLPEWWNEKRNRLSATALTLDSNDVVSNVDLTLGVAGSISGNIEGYTGGSIGGVLITAENVDTGETTSVDQLGDFYTITNLAEGDYLVKFEAALPSDNWVTEWWDDSLTEEGATIVTVGGAAPLDRTGIDAVIFPGAEIGGQVVDSLDGTTELAGMEATLFWEGEEYATTTTGSDGRYLFRRLPEGSYTVRFSDPTDTFVTQWSGGAATQAGATEVEVVFVTGDLGVDAELDRRLTAVGTPGISGDAMVGSMLTADQGVWEPTPITFSYQWMRDGVDIAGADEEEYFLVGADFGAEISVEVTGSRAGYASESRESNAIGPVVAGALAPTPIPTIGGTATVGSTLTATPGTWGPAPVSLAYQWYRDGAPIASATASSYNLTVNDVGFGITVRVTATKAGYTTVFRTSAPVGPVPALTLTATPTPTISGTAQVGEQLTASAGSWQPAPVTLAYQWLRNGSPISGATSDTYTAIGADLGAALSVRVTGSKVGYTAVQRTSDETDPVAPPPEPVTRRLAGDDRFATSVEVSKEFAPFAEGEGVVYLANGLGFADALSAAPAAAFLDAPLLLTQSTTIPATVQAELVRLGPATVKVVGGTGVIANSVVSQVQSLLPEATIERVSGDDRYATSQAVTEDAFGDDGASTAFVATGTGFADALAASAAAGAFDAPVLLVNGSASTVPSSVRTLLEDLGVTDVYIAGGVGVVSAGVFSTIDGWSFTDSVVRLSGDDRYATSEAINAFAFQSSSSAYLAVGTGFADALAGAALAGGTQAPLFIVPPTCVPGGVLDQIESLGALDVVLLGGTGVLSSGVANLNRC